MHDKKSDHYTSAENYKDQDGNMKSFTFIDHDVKTSIPVSKMTQKERKELDDSVKEHTEKSIKEILAMPAVAAALSHGEYEGFILRDPEKGILWRDEMVANACRINPVLRHNLYLQVWRNTVREAHWFTELTHEEILAGEWSKLT